MAMTPEDIKRMETYNEYVEEQNRIDEWKDYERQQSPHDSDDR